jgi:hypothetical protein
VPKPERAYGHAQLSKETVKIGVLADMSGLYSDLSGIGSVVAAQMAAEDFGGTGPWQEDRDHCSGSSKQTGHWREHRSQLDRSTGGRCHRTFIGQR